jgi:hypothetical protein
MRPTDPAPHTDGPEAEIKHRDRALTIAKAIFDWFDQEAGNLPTQPLLYNTFQDELTVGISGEIDLQHLAAAIDRTLGPSPENSPERGGIGDASEILAKHATLKLRARLDHAAVALEWGNQPPESIVDLLRETSRALQPPKSPMRGGI